MILNEKSNGYDRRITLEVSDPENQIAELLQTIKVIANSGHTFDIIVDPHSESPRSFEIDGDGACYIKSIDLFDSSDN